MQRLIAYNCRDVEVEREADDRLLQLSDAEQAIWVLSNKINAARLSCRSGSSPRPRARSPRPLAPEINAEMAAITDGAVTSINQVDKTETVAAICTAARRRSSTARRSRSCSKDDELTTPARRALELRLDGAQAAVKKIDALLARAGHDDRVRGAFKYHGASTGRWAGEGLSRKISSARKRKISTPRSPRSRPATMRM